MKKSLLFVSILSAAMLLAGCNQPDIVASSKTTEESSSSSSKEVDTSKIATELKLTAQSPLTLKVGEEASIGASVLPATASQKVNYASSVEGILDATSLAAGTIKGLAAGETVVTVTTEALNAEGKALSATLNVTVEAEDDGTTPISMITAPGTYTTKGVVAAKTSKGFVLDDGKAALYVFKTTTLDVGAYVTVEGSVVNYFGLLEYSKTITVTEREGTAPTLAAPTTLTEDLLTEYKAYGSDNILPTTKMQPMTFTAACVKDGNFSNFYLTEGGIKIGALHIDTSNPSFSGMKDGTTYTVTGYPTTYNTKNNFFQFVFGTAVAA